MNYFNAHYQTDAMRVTGRLNELGSLEVTTTITDEGRLYGKLQLDSGFSLVSVQLTAEQMRTLADTFHMHAGRLEKLAPLAERVRDQSTQRAKQAPHPAARNEGSSK